MKRIFALILILGLMITTIACAEMTVQHYKVMMNDPNLKEYALAYICGIGQGISYANTYLMGIKKQKPLFCQPMHLALQDKNYIDMLDRQIKNSISKNIDDKPIPLLLLYGFIEIFPCE